MNGSPGGTPGRGVEAVEWLRGVVQGGLLAGFHRTS